MTKLQKFLTTILPKKWANNIEKESRQWKVRCDCGQETSIWELGGIRWKAKGSPKQLIKYPKCNKSTTMTVFKDESAK